jgi:hypothetical protein
MKQNLSVAAVWLLEYRVNMLPGYHFSAQT